MDPNSARETLPCDLPSQAAHREPFEWRPPPHGGLRLTLFPARNGLVETANRARQELQGLLNANREVKPVSSLSNELFRNSVNGMASTIQQELAAKLQ